MRITIVLLLAGQLFLLGGCRTLPTRVVSDPAPAELRLRAGGSIKAEVDYLAQPLVMTGQIHGIAVGVLTDDGSVNAFGYGRTGVPGDVQLPDGDTIFQIGSVSKLFLTALLSVLVDEGVLRYEDTVRSILSEEVQLDEEAGKVTIYELATNTGGFPRQPFTQSQMWDFFGFLFTGRNLYGYFDKPYLYDYLREKHPKPKQPREYVYSNIGLGLLGHLIEVKTGRPFQDLLEEKICRPLKLRNTTFVLTEEQKGRLAIGHAGDQPYFMRRGRPMAPWEMGEIMRPSGGLYSTVNDLLTFAKSNFGMLNNSLDPLLARTQVIQLKRPEQDVAFGWLVNYLGEDRLKVTYKQGLMSGYTSYIGMSAENRVAVVVLYNTFSWDEKVGHNLVLRLSRGLSPHQTGTPFKLPSITQPSPSRTEQNKN